MEADSLKLDGLDKLLKALGDNQPVLRVGLLGDGTTRSDGDGETQLSNADIGAIHEFGSAGRSFLRMPLIDQLTKRMESEGAVSKKELATTIATGSIATWLNKIGALAKGIILDAFDSGGFGKWKPSDMRYKKNHQTLVETQQLRDSITWDVK
jgi:hypothetical protein